MTPRPLPAWARLQLKVQAASALILGLSLIFLPAPLILYNPITTFISDAIFQHPLSPISHLTTNDSLNQTLALSGVFSCAIGTAYSLAFLHGYDEWLYMSIPARLVVCALGHLVYLLVPEKTSPLLFVICIWDGIWAGMTAWAVRSVSGRVPEGASEGTEGAMRLRKE